ncbi:adenosine receptor A2a-like [Pecten maximus]|uniref:adenosine receptor A2a-like n=1 Tax=Pecten maximus TaxID=6579 RepID=UPI0014588B16|nr:adenosine receptor A2a-like [Pecten maximus]
MFYFKLTFVQSVKYLCLFKFSSVCASMTASMINLVAIGVDRYVAILHPLKYKTILTYKRVRIFIVCMWIYIVPVCVLPLVWNSYDEVQICDYFKILPLAYTIYAAFFSIGISLVVSLYLYIRIFLVARQQQKQVRKDSLRGNHSIDPQMEKDTKSAKVMALILFLFYIFWVPFTIIGPIKYSVDIDNDLAETLKNITLFLAMTNSMINPIIYCWLRREFREAFRSICIDSCCYHSKANQKENFGNSLLFNSISTEQHREEAKSKMAL